MTTTDPLTQLFSRFRRRRTARMASSRWAPMASTRPARSIRWGAVVTSSAVALTSLGATADASAFPAHGRSARTEIAASLTRPRCEEYQLNNGGTIDGWTISGSMVLVCKGKRPIPPYSDLYFMGLSLQAWLYECYGGSQDDASDPNAGMTCQAQLDNVNNSLQAASGIVQQQGSTSDPRGSVDIGVPRQPFLNLLSNLESAILSNPLQSSWPNVPNNIETAYTALISTYNQATGRRLAWPSL